MADIKNDFCDAVQAVLLDDSMDDQQKLREIRHIVIECQARTEEIKEKILG